MPSYNWSLYKCQGTFRTSEAKVLSLMSDLQQTLNETKCNSFPSVRYKVQVETGYEVLIILFLPGLLLTSKDWVFLTQAPWMRA